MSWFHAAKAAGNQDDPEPLEITLVSAATLYGQHHARMGPSGTCTIQIPPRHHSADVVLLTIQSMTLASDPEQNSISTVMRKWVRPTAPVTMASVSRGPRRTFTVVFNPVPHVPVDDVSAEVAADNRAAHTALEQDHRRLHAKHPKALRHPLAVRIEVESTADPEGDPRCINMGVPLLKGMVGTGPEWHGILADICTYARAALGCDWDAGPRSLVRAAISVGVASVRGPYQAELSRKEDDRALSFGVQQDCDDSSLLIGAVLNGLKAAATRNDFTPAPGNEAAIMAELARCTPHFAHVLASPPGSKKPLGHAICIVATGRDSAGRLEDAWCIEPTACTVPATSQMPATANRAMCRQATDADYHRVYLVADASSVLYPLSGAGREATDGVEARLFFNTSKPTYTAYKCTYAPTAQHVVQSINWGDCARIARAVCPCGVECPCPPRADSMNSVAWSSDGGASTAPFLGYQSLSGHNASVTRCGW